MDLNLQNLIALVAGIMTIFGVISSIITRSINRIDGDIKTLSLRIDASTQALNARTDAAMTRTDAAMTRMDHFQEIILNLLKEKKESKVKK